MSKNTINNIPTIHFVIPSNLDLESILKSHKTSINIRGYSYTRINGKKRKTYELKNYKPHSLLKHIKYCYWFINELWRRRVYYDEYESPKDYINLDVESISRFIPDDTIPLVKNLLEHLEIIEINPKFSNDPNNPFSMSYRLSEMYRESLSQLIELNDIPFKSKIINRYKKKIWLDEMPDHVRYMHGQYNRIRFNTELAISVLTSLHDHNKLTNDQFNELLAHLIPFIDGRFYFKWKDYKHHRIYNSVAGLASVLRPLIQDENGDGMVLLDYSSSLPSHLFAYLWEILRSDNDIDINKFELLAELEKYQKLLEAGELYERISEILELREESNKGFYVDNSTAKSIFLIGWLNVAEDKESEMTQIINQEFPMMTSIKNQIRNINPNLLFNDLSKQESDLVLNNVVPRLIKELNEPIFFTIHDAILIQQKHADKAKKIMEEEAKKFLNLNAVVKQKNLSIKEAVIKYREDKFIDKVAEGHAKYLNVNHANELIRVWEEDYRFLDRILELPQSFNIQINHQLTSKDLLMYLNGNGKAYDNLIDRILDETMNGIRKVAKDYQLK